MREPWIPWGDGMPCAQCGRITLHKVCPACALAAERDRLAARVAALEAALAPGTAPAIVDAMFREAQRLGQSPYESKHALGWLVREIETLRAALASRTHRVACLEARVAVLEADLVGARRDSVRG
jgi:BMFP domain-containing protein YqiC